MQPANARDEIDSLLAWWQLAGVDAAIDEAPQHWLTPTDAAARPAPTANAPVTPPAPVPAPATATLPDFATLAQFRQWFASDTTLLGAYPPPRRVLPGDHAADLAIVIDQPGRDDLAAGQLMAGDVGVLLDRMLAAMKRSRADVAIIAMAPARTAAELDEPAQALLTPILWRHLALLAPKQLWLMGNSASRAILKMDVLAAQGRLHCVNHGDTTMDAIATVHPALLIRQPRLKARVWDDMQRLVGETKI